MDERRNTADAPSHGDKRDREPRRKMPVPENKRAPAPANKSEG
jgi:hypothetical protein